MDIHRLNTHIRTHFSIPVFQPFLTTHYISNQAWQRTPPVSSVLSAASGPCECVCRFSLCWALVSLKSLLNSLAPYDIKQTQLSIPTSPRSLPNPLTYHVPSIFLLYLHPGHHALSLRTTPPPLPCSSLGDVVSFQERLPSLLPYENTISPFTSFSVSLFISPPLLFSTVLILL